MRPMFILITYTYLYTCVIIPRTAVSSMVRNCSLGQLASSWWSLWVADLCSLVYWGIVTNFYLFSKMFTSLLLKLDTLKDNPIAEKVFFSNFAPWVVCTNIKGMACDPSQSGGI